MIHTRLRRQSGRTKNASRSRVALVGCGRRSASVIEPALIALKARAVLVVDPDREARNRVIGRLGDDHSIEADVFTPEVLDQARPDAVIISSPSGLHFRQAMTSLKHGIATFVEKPLACNAADARTLSALGSDLLEISEQRIHRRDIRLVDILIRSGALGKIRRLGYYDSVAPYRKFKNTWRNDPELACGGVLLDLGYHTIGTIQWLLRQDNENFTISFTRFQQDGLEVESRVQAVCTWGGVEIDLDIGLDQESPQEELTVYGSRATLKITRDRTKQSVSTASLVRRCCVKNVEISLGNCYDSKVLSSFISGINVADRTARHVMTLEFLEKIYKHTTGGIAQCG